MEEAALSGFGIVDAGIARDVFVPAGFGAVTVLCGPNDSGKSTILRAIAGGTHAVGTGAIVYWSCEGLDDRLLDRLLTDPDGGLRRDDDAWLVASNLRLPPGVSEPFEFDFSRSARSFGGILERAWRGENLVAVGTFGAEEHTIGLATLPTSIAQEDLVREIERISGNERSLFSQLMAAASWGRNVLLIEANARAEGALQLIRYHGEDYGKALVDDLRRYFELDGVENWGAVLSDRLDPAAMPPTLRLMLSGNSVLASQLVSLDELRAVAEKLADEDKERDQEATSTWLQDLRRRNPLGGRGPYMTIVGPAIDESTVKALIASELTAVAQAISGKEGSSWVNVISEFPLVQEVLADVADAADGMGVIASRFASGVGASALAGAPTLTVRIRENRDVRLFVNWGDGSDIPIGDVAEGLRQWLLLGFALASVIASRVTGEPMELRDGHAAAEIADEPDSLSGVVLILDEPERHLHPTLQREAARFVESLARDHGAAVIVATHAATFLRIRDASILEVARPTRTHCETRALGRRAVEENLEIAGRLGFDRGVIADTANAFLLVEGKQDEALLDAWFGEQLALARIRVVPFHGTRQLGSSSWALENLVAVSGLPVAILLDSTPDIERIRRIVATPGDSRRPPVIEDIADQMAYKNNQDVCDVLRRLDTRAKLFVHDEPDILFFVDEKQFRARKGRPYTHEQARRQIDRSRGSRGSSVAGERIDAKVMLARHFGIDEDFFRTQHLLRAAKQGRAPVGTSLNLRIDEITAWADSQSTS